MDSLDVNKARAIHRVIRAIHDGECPRCQHLADASNFRVPEGHRCPKCGFHITKEQTKKGLKLFASFMLDAVEVFEGWKNSDPQLNAMPQTITKGSYLDQFPQTPKNQT